MGAASLAIRGGMGFVEIDDLRSAMDKAMIMLLDGLDGPENPADAPNRAPSEADSFIEVIFRIADNRFEFEARRTDPARVPETAARLFGDATREFVDELRVDTDTGAIRFSKALTDVR